MTRTPPQEPTADHKGQRRSEARWRRSPKVVVAAGALVAVIVTAFVASNGRLPGTDGDGGGSASERASASVGLPDSPDYHSLIVAPEDSQHVFLGTHIGLFESKDGGASWRQTGAIDGDAMNLARDATNADVLYAAGHELFQKSSDGGNSWKDIPLDDAISQTRAIDGSKGVDIHGFAADPTNANTVYAAVAAKGLYKSTDAGESFVKLSDTGAAGFGVALATTKPRRIYLADTQRGLLRSQDEGRTWDPLQAGVISVAIAPDDQRRVLATGKAIYLSIDGTTFKAVRDSAEGFGPVTFAPSDPQVAYVIGFDRTLYVSDDAGATWTAR